MSKKIDSAIRFFLYVLIFWIPYSPAVIEICVITALVLWLIKRGLQGADFRLPHNALNKPIAFFLLACLVSMIGTIDPERSFSNFLTKTVEWFVVYFLFLEVFTKRRHIYTALIIFAFTALSTCLDGLQQFYITHKDIFLGYVLTAESPRATAGFKHANLLGGFLTVVVPFSFSLLFSVKSPAKKFFHYGAWFFFMAAVWAVLITTSRGAWMGIIAGSVFLLFFIKKRWFIYIGISILIILIGVFAFPSVRAKQMMRANDLQSTMSWRMDLWKNSITMIKAKPFFGHGVNSFMWLFPEYRSKHKDVHRFNPVYAHNCFLQIAAETGITGLIGFFWILLNLFGGAVPPLTKAYKAQSDLALWSLGLLSGIFAFLIHSMMDTHFYTLQLSIFFWAMTGLLMASVKIIKEGTARG